MAANPTGMMNRPRDASIENLNRYADELERKNAELERRHEALEKQFAELSAKTQWLEEQFRLAQHRRFGASSERTVHEQVSLLLDEAEAIANPAIEEPTFEKVTIRRRKTKGQRDEDLKDLPVERVEYRLNEDEMQCPACEGSLHEMSTQVRRELVVIPAQVKVREHVQYVYGCRTCEREAISTPIKAAKMPAPPIPGSLASPSALAHMMAQKYVEGLPLYRQANQLERFGVTLSRQTMGNWVLEGSKRWLSLVYDRMRELMVQKDILHADETTVQVLREPGRKAESQSYMWLYRTGRDGPLRLV